MANKLSFLPFLLDVLDYCKTGEMFKNQPTSRSWQLSEELVVMR